MLLACQKCGCRFRKYDIDLDKPKEMDKIKCPSCGEYFREKFEKLLEYGEYEAERQTIS